MPNKWVGLKQKMELKDIIQDILDGKRTRRNDELGAGGLWDYTYQEILKERPDEMTTERQYEMERIYMALWDIVELLKI